MFSLIIYQKGHNETKLLNAFLSVCVLVFPGASLHAKGSSFFSSLRLLISLGCIGADWSKKADLLNAY